MSEDRLHSLLVVAFAFDGVDATLAALEHSGQARRHVPMGDKPSGNTLSAPLASEYT